jgi:hypothetical protein
MKYFNDKIIGIKSAYSLHLSIAGRVCTNKMWMESQGRVADSQNSNSTNREFGPCVRLE